MHSFGYPPPVKFDVQGHRGCPSLLPENTIASFIKAVEIGVSTLELDVVISKDRKVVVSHEPYLNRKICLDPNGKKIKKNKNFNLFTMPYAEIKKCDCGTLRHPDFVNQENSFQYKPLLEEVIHAVKNYCLVKGIELPVFNVEIKSNSKKVGISQPPVAEFCKLVMDVLQQNLPLQHYYLQSFDVATLQFIKANYPDVKIAFLVMGYVKKTNASFKKEMKKLGFYPEIYSCYYPILSKKLIKELHSKDIAVIPWTVNEEGDMKDLIQMQVDGIITDYPNRLLNVIKELK